MSETGGAVVCNGIVRAWTLCDAVREVLRVAGDSCRENRGDPQGPDPAFVSGALSRVRGHRETGPDRTQSARLCKTTRVIAGSLVAWQP